jgi:hypothetical protein
VAWATQSSALQVDVGAHVDSRRTTVFKDFILVSFVFQSVQGEVPLTLHLAVPLTNSYINFVQRVELCLGILGLVMLSWFTPPGYQVGARGIVSTETFGDMVRQLRGSGRSKYYNGIADYCFLSKNSE